MSKIGFLIFPGFPMSCLTSMIEPLRAANEISNQQTFSWKLIAQDHQPVESSAGISFAPDYNLESAPQLDYLILLSAPTIEFSDPRSPAHLRRLERHGTKLGAISGGVFPLARSGVIREEPLSIHWCYEAAFAAEFPTINRSDDVIEISSRRISASGAAAAFDLALLLIEDQLNTQIAHEVACWFQHPMIRKPGVKQALPIDSLQPGDTEQSPLVVQAIHIYAEDLANPTSIATIAEELDITPRHLERLFKQSTGQNPSGYFRSLRMKAARQIVMYTNTSIADIAAAVGYSSPKPFLKQYKSHYGVSPLEERKRINLYRVEANRVVPSI